MTLRAFIEDILDRILNAIRALHIEITNTTFTGSIVSFVSKYAGLPLKSCKVNIPVMQEGTGDPSPDNVRNFVGITSLDFTANSVVKTFQFGQTIYAGELDVLTGILRVTYGVVDLGTLNWERRSNADYYYFRNITNINNIKSGIVYQIGNIRSTIYEAVQSRFSADFVNYKMFVWTDGKIYLRNDDYTDANDFKTAMSGIQLVYELATPTTIQLPPCPIDTLQGINNIWADTGETTIVTIEPKIKGGN